MYFSVKRKNISSYLAISGLLLSFSLPVFAQETRGINDDAVSLDDYLSTPTYNYSTPERTVLKGDVSKLEATVGKSKMIRFDEPAKRISIADPSLADIVLISPREILINGKTAGLTSLIVWGDGGDPAFFDLRIKNDSVAFLNAVNDVIPDDRFNFEFTDKGAILSGVVSSTIKREKINSIAKAYGFELLDLAESPTPQVAIEVKVAEVSRSFSKNLGTMFSKGPKAVDMATATGDAGTRSVYMVDFSGDNGLDYMVHSPSDKFAAEFQAGVTKGFVRVLAEPKLITSNGSEASFNAGQEVPVPSSIGMGGNVAYEFKKVGVIMTIKPKIQETLNRISLDITPEVSEIDTQASSGSVYGFKTRKVNTHVELMNGQTLIIAGLIKHSDNNTNTQIPGLGDLPFFGHLFKSTTQLKNDTELMIFVTPKIIKQEETADRI